MSEKLPVRSDQALNDILLPPDSPYNSKGLRMLIEFDRVARSRIPAGLDAEEYETRRLAILMAFIANGYADIIPGDCFEIRPEPRIR